LYALKSLILKDHPHAPDRRVYVTKNDVILIITSIIAAMVPSHAQHCALKAKALESIEASRKMA
jgi:hypothetical protein